MGIRTHYTFVLDTVAPFSKGGRETRLDEITRRLAAQGHDVHVYTMRWWEGARDIEIAGVHFHAIMPKRPIYANGRRSLLTSLWFGIACAKLLFKRLDHVDVDQIPYFPVLTMRAVCWIRRRKLTVTCCEYWGADYWNEYLGAPGRVAAFVERATLKMADQVVTISTQTTHQVDRLTIHRPVHTVPLGVDVGRIDRIEPAADPVDVIYAGRLLEHKNVDMLVRAVAVLAAPGVQLRARIVGEGPEQPRLRALALELGVRGSIEIRGFYPDEADLYAAIKASRVLVLPSSREGFGLIALEANACGIPVVTVDHPQNAAKDLIVSGVNGLVVAPTPHALAAALERVLAHPDDWDASAIRASSLRYSWDTVAQEVSDALVTAR